MRTPILDRKQPLPEPVSFLSNVPLAPVIACMVIAAVVMTIYVLRALHSGDPAVEEWLMKPRGLAGLVGLVVSLTVAILVTIGIHEVGHALAGKAAGFEVLSVRIGPLLWSGGRLTFVRGSFEAFVSGETRATPRTIAGLGKRAAIYAAGGPAANLLAGGLLLLAFVRGTFWHLCALFSFFFAVTELMPAKSHRGVSDGGRLAMLRSDRKRAARWLALMMLTAEARKGTPPESLPPELMATATAVRDQSPDTVPAFALAYAAAIHRGEPAADELLETCLRAAGYASRPMRIALMTDAASYQATVRKCPELAQEWEASMATVKTRAT